MRTSSKIVLEKACKLESKEKIIIVVANKLTVGVMQRWRMHASPLSAGESHEALSVICFAHLYFYQKQSAVYFICRSNIINEILAL